MKPYRIIAFYKFVPIDYHHVIREPMRTVMQCLDIKGTIILASEGINGGFAGLSENVDKFIQYLRSFADFKDISWKTHFDTENPFDKAKVKCRKEIVTMGVPGVDARDTGVYLDGKGWNEIIQDPNTLLIDTRNDYEVEIGTFKGAINPNTENFRDFPAFVEQHLMDKKDKNIAMCCTGGVRCEKSTAYLKQLGFKNVYQLHGGILRYLETMPKEQSLWEGDCFVFDNRIAVDDHLDKSDLGSGAHQLA